MLENFFNKKENINQDSDPYEFVEPFSTVQETIKKMIKISRDRDVFCDFDGVKIEIKKGASPNAEDLYKKFKIDQTRHMADYVDSEEYKQKRKQEKAKLTETQVVMDKLMEDFLKLDFSNTETVMDWFVVFEKSHLRGIDFNSYRIVTTLIDHGYKMDEYGVKDNKNEEEYGRMIRNDKEKYAKYIIGQVISNLDRREELVNYTLDKIPTWIKDWKERYGSK